MNGAQKSRMVYIAEEKDKRHNDLRSHQECTVYMSEIVG